MISLFKNRHKNPADEVLKRRKAYRLKGIKHDINQMKLRIEIMQTTIADIEESIEKKQEEFVSIQKEHDEF